MTTNRAERETTPKVDCAEYAPLPGKKRCRHYLDGGRCGQPSRDRCVEWLRLNPKRELPPPPPTDLFGNLVRAPKNTQRVKPHRAPQGAASAHAPASDEPAADLEPTPDRPGMTAEHIESFKALGVEVCLSSDEFGDVFLVPEYTGDDRNELTPEHAATISRALDVFPGSRVTAFRRRKRKELQVESPGDASGAMRPDRSSDEAEEKK